MAYCATNPAGGKTLCSTAASQYKTSGASSTKPSSSTSSTTLSYNEVWQWHGGKPNKDAEAEKSTCTRLKQTQASIQMRQWYCSQPANSESNWCKRSALLDKLNKIPSSTQDPTLSAERKSLSTELAAFSKPSAGGGPSMTSLIAKEIVTAKNSYCAVETNKQIAYCKTSSPGAPAPFSSTSGLTPRPRPPAHRLDVPPRVSPSLPALAASWTHLRDHTEMWGTMCGAPIPFVCFVGTALCVSD